MVDVAVGRDLEHPVEEDLHLPSELLADDGGDLLAAVDLLEEGAAAVAEVDAQRVAREVGAAAGEKAVDRYPLAAEAGDDLGQVVARKEPARIARQTAAVSRVSAPSSLRPSSDKAPRGTSSSSTSVTVSARRAWSSRSPQISPRARSQPGDEALCNRRISR